MGGGGGLLLRYLILFLLLHRSLYPISYLQEKDETAKCNTSFWWPHENKI